MALSKTKAVDQAKILLTVRDNEESKLAKIHSYWRGKQRFEWLASQVPGEIRRLAEMSRVNVIKLVVDTQAQGLYVDGYRSARASEDEAVWDVWQRNRFDARQIGVHRAAVAYGLSYVTVLPGDPVPVMRGASPRKLTTLYGEDDWPMWALEKRGKSKANQQLYRLIDDEAVYWLSSDGGEVEWISTQKHGAGVTPVVRFRAVEDLDDDVLGEVEPYYELQDQINVTTFALLVAQHYGAFRQRYILGWIADSEEQKLKASAERVWTFEDSPNEIAVGEFGQTDIKGHIESREATLRHLATVSQTPAHELLGQLVNLSAEALAAAEASRDRKQEQTQRVMGESHEQGLGRAGQYLGRAPDPKAYVRWRDTTTQSLPGLVDALGKLVQMLGVPPQALWERVADALGISQQELDDWKAQAEQGDPLAGLGAMLDRQEA